MFQPFFMNRLLVPAFALLFMMGSLLGSEELIHHDLVVKLHPEEHKIQVQDILTLPKRFVYNKSIPFLLNKHLEVTCQDNEHQVSVIHNRDPAQPDHVKQYEITRKDNAPFPQKPVIVLSYKGVIHSPFESASEEYAKGFNQTLGMVSKQGSYLSGAAYWVPAFGEDLAAFDLMVELPANRFPISQGRMLRDEKKGDKRWVKWSCPRPMDDIYLIEGEFHPYVKQAGLVSAQVYLRKPDPNLAAKYLDATGQYIEMYSKLIGPYPFTKFALVENFWETGYGMPSFTLLGPRVIRFPFILRSSYPHEILHNWWGNSVFVNYEKGNWCEGLTAYLADHMFKEMDNQGRLYRRDTLLKYANYVKEEKDFPLTQFTERHSSATEAVGYGKSLMLFHMLRKRLGDDLFIECIRTFYQMYRFKRASFEDLESVFSQKSRQDLKPFFLQWTHRVGAPQVKINGYGYAHFGPEKGGFLKVELRQVQKEAPFEITVPLGIHYEGEKEIEFHDITMKERTASLELEKTRPIVKVELDPLFDIFRRLDPKEIPPTIGAVFGAVKCVIILPETQSKETNQAWEKLASSWARNKGVEVAKESRIRELPSDRAVWILGRHNRWAPKWDKDLSSYGVTKQEDSLELGDKSIPLMNHSFVLTYKHPKNPDLAAAWVCANPLGAIPGLSRKLPHYGKYSYLGFEGLAPNNTLKGQWPAMDSPMVIRVDPDKSCPYPRESPLTEPKATGGKDHLVKHLSYLADDKLKGRGLGSEGLDLAAAHIAKSFESYGLEPFGKNNSFYLDWETRTGPDSKTMRLRNVVGAKPGSKPELSPVLVCAHYDHLGLGWPDVHQGDEGQIHNGADDNASGVAVMLELSHGLQKQSFKRTILFAAFTGEEAGILGSRKFAEDHKDLFAVINLDSVGRLEGKKLTVFGVDSAREWTGLMMGVGFTVGLEAVCITRDPGAGDHISFREIGIPAIHLFTGAHSDYHRPGDDLEKIDFKGLLKVLAFVKEATVYLADREEALNFTSQNTPKGPSKKTGAKGRASLGLIPDFSYQDKGVRIGSVLPDSPAEKSGLKAKDVIMQINDMGVEDLRAYAELLKKFKPNDTVSVHIQRDGEKLVFQAKLKAR